MTLLADHDNGHAIQYVQIIFYDGLMAHLYHSPFVIMLQLYPKGDMSVHTRFHIKGDNFIAEINKILN